MVKDSNRPPFSPFQEQCELELLQFILQGTDMDPYPWNPADLGATAYFEEREQEVVALGWAEEDYTPYVQVLSQSLDQVWSTLQTPVAARPSLRIFSANLYQRLSAQVPPNLLDTIVQQAQQALASNLAVADQLVLCLQDVVSGLGSEDLRVMARPFAYTMRDALQPQTEADILNDTLRTIRDADWADLNEIEQARLGLAIARYTLAQIPQSENS